MKANRLYQVAHNNLVSVGSVECTLQLLEDESNKIEVNNDDLGILLCFYVFFNIFVIIFILFFV